MSVVISGFGIFCDAQANSASNVWDVLRKQFSLNHETHQAAVQNQIRWLVSHPSYLQNLSQSEPYIYHIITEIKKRNLPGELALIPMIESDYDPFAYSGAGAAGLWQLMPGTGTDLGLKRDWWFDGRRSIRPSTDAALNYLTYLHKCFKGDWLLAFAAYDSGEGTIRRLIKKSRQTRHVSFWSLPVPQETRAYIPRLLALAEVIQYPERYHVQLPKIPNVPYFEEVNIGSQIDLNHAAKLAGISYKDLIKLNPGYNRWTTAPYQPFKLLIPVNRVKTFNQNLANLPEDKRTSWTRHEVRAGESLTLIATQYHTTTHLIKQLNQLKTNQIKKGQLILIPNNKNTLPGETQIAAQSKQAQTSHFTPAKPYKVIHIVQKKDSFSQLQKKYGASESDIRQWNHLKPKTKLRTGQQLIIWKRIPASGIYIVQKGDCMIKIAKKNNVNPHVLARLNPGVSDRNLRPGQHVTLG